MPEKFFKTPIAQALTTCAAIIGTLWAVIEIMQGFLPEWSVTCFLSSHIAVLILPGMVGGVVQGVYAFVNQRYLTYKRKDKIIKIRRGDILNKRKGTIVIGVNRQLVTDPDKIARDSIHWQLISRCGKRVLEDIFEKQRNGGCGDRCFFTGQAGGLDIVFLMMSDLGENGTVRTSLDMMTEALEDFFNHQENLQIKKGKVYLPLLGLGRTGAPLECNEAVKLIIRKYLQFQKQLNGDSVDKIRELELVIYKDNVRSVDWGKLKEDLDLYFFRCCECGGFRL